MIQERGYWAALFLALAVVLTSGGCRKIDFGRASKGNDIASTPAPVKSWTGGDVATAPPVGLPDFSALVEKEGPAVVNVSVTQVLARGEQQFPGIDEDDPLFD